MRCTPTAPSRREGGPPEEERRAPLSWPPLSWPPPPRPLIFPYWRPGLPKKKHKWAAAAERVPPAEASAAGSGGAGASGAWEAAAACPPPPAVESDLAGEEEQCESKSTSSGGSSPTLAAKTDSLQQQERLRIKFTPEQLQKLEKTFQKQKYLTASERIQLAALLDVAEENVASWFHNRRTRHKREHHDPKSLPPAPLSLQNPRFPTRLFQDFSLYPQQNSPSFLPNTALQSSLFCTLYQPSTNPPYPVLTLGLPYYFPPQPLMLPGIPNEEEDCKEPSPK